jgi:hypothetical protein
MPRPVELPEHLQRNFRTRWMESVLGATLVLLVVVAVTAGGFVVIRSIWPTQPTAAREADAEPTADGPADGTPAAPTPADAALLKPAKPLDRPVELAGEWDSRADDGSHSAFDFHPDGTVVITPANYPQTPAVRAQWYVADQRGDDLAVDVGTEFGAAGNYRFVLRFNGLESFTLTRTIRNGVSTSSQLRYVRVGPPRFGVTAAEKPSTAPPP